MEAMTIVTPGDLEDGGANLAQALGLAAQVFNLAQVRSVRPQASPSTVGAGIVVAGTELNRR